MSEISLCPHCGCMTKTTIYRKCGKCGVFKKNETGEKIHFIEKFKNQGDNNG